MANTFNGQVALSWQFDLEKPLTGLNNVVAQQAKNNKLVFADGTGAGKAEEVYSVVLTVGAGASTTLDLSGSLVNPVCDTVAFTKVKAVLFELLSETQDAAVGTACSSVLIGGAAATQAFAGAGKMFGDVTDKIRVLNGGLFALGVANANGMAVVGAASDSLKIENEDGAVDAALRITMFGEKT